MNIVVGIAIGLIVILAILELSLQSLFGFGKPLIYVADPQIGYLLAPNQTTQRFGKQIAINQYSMRGSAITPNRPVGTLRLLLLGDSIANGGWWTDQTQTISALLQQQIQPQPLGFQQVEVLNASANSWGPRNELAYLQRFSHFDAQWIVLLINTDDLFATLPSSAVVGRDRNYPDRLPPLALTEVMDRYFTKPQPIPELEALQKAEGDRVGANLAAILEIQTIAKTQQVQFLLVMTPLLREVGDPGPRDYEQKARQRLTALTQQHHILFVDGLPLFNSIGHPATLYRDHIHLSASGNQLIIEQIWKAVTTTKSDQ